MEHLGGPDGRRTEPRIIGFALPEDDVGQLQPVHLAGVLVDGDVQLADGIRSGPGPRTRPAADGDLSRSEHPGQYLQRHGDRSGPVPGQRERLQCRGPIGFRRTHHRVEECPEPGRRLAGHGGGELGRTGQRPVAADEFPDLRRQGRVGVEPRSLPHERGDRCVGIEGVERHRPQEYRSAEGGRVIGDGSVVPDHGIGRQQGLPPLRQRIDQRQPAAPRAIEPGTDLTGAVPVPDVGVQYGGETVLVHGELVGDPVEQRGDDIPSAPAVPRNLGPVTEERLRVPGRVEQDEPLTGAYPQRAAEAPATGACGEDPVEAGVAA